jgi:hypothetical protein
MRRTAVLAVLFSALAATPVRAQNASPLPACPEGDLLAGKKPIQWQEVRRELSLLTDESIAPEGSQWDSQPAVIFDTAASIVTWDLGQLTLVRSFAIQADANDTYTVWGSVDGKEYKVFGQIDPVPNHGLRMRVLNVGGMPARYLRVGEGVGDSFFSISEVAAYCQVPSPFPPAMKVVDAPPAAVPPKKLLDYWDNDASARWELTLALLGIWFIWWEAKVRAAGGRAPAPGRWRKRLGGAFNRIMDRQAKWFARSKVRNALVGVMGVLAFLTYFNFGWFHFPNFIHGWDTFHYYIGSKYFKELSYERLYECVAVADSEEPNLRRRVELRKMTNLRTNLVETTADILAHPERCKSHFTPERWESLKHDLRYFRTLENPRRWDDAQTDHGYNGTPVWNIAGTLLSNLAPASRTQVLILDSIDCFFVVLFSLMIWWAFGWRTLTIGLIAFSTNFPSRWYWTGGSLLRWDWLFWMVAAVCLLKKERFFYAGMCLAYSTLLRIFPVFMFIAPLIAAVYHYVKHKQLEKRFFRFFAGAAVATALLVPVSVVTAGGVQAYPAFIRNTIKHSETPLTNYMGLRTVVNYRPSEVGRLMRNDSLVDPWSRWKEARLKSFHEARPLFFGIIACYLVLIGLAVRGVDPWITVALSATLIAFGVELTCYYYAFIIVVALLFAKYESAGKWLLAVTAFTQFIGWAPIQGMPEWLGKILPAAWRNSPNFKNFGMPTGLDEQYTWMALATLIGFVMIAWDMMVVRQRELAPAGAQVPSTVEAAKAPEPEVEEEAEEDDDDDRPREDRAQPVWRERLDRRMHGGKRRRHR